MNHYTTLILEVIVIHKANDIFYIHHHVALEYLVQQQTVLNILNSGSLDMMIPSMLIFGSKVLGLFFKCKKYVISMFNQNHFKILFYATNLIILVVQLESGYFIYKARNVIQHAFRINQSRYLASKEWFFFFHIDSKSQHRAILRRCLAACSH